MSKPKNAVNCFFKHEAGGSSRITLIYIQTVLYIFFCLPANMTVQNIINYINPVVCALFLSNQPKYYHNGYRTDRYSI